MCLIFTLGLWSASLFDREPVLLNSAAITFRAMKPWSSETIAIARICMNEVLNESEFRK